jgi:hypothetical protein
MTAPGPATRTATPAVRLSGWRATVTWAAAAAAITLGIAAAILLLQPGDTPVFVLPLFGVMTVSYAVVGALVATRQPHNAVGWLLLGAAVIMGGSMFGSSYAIMSVDRFGASLPGTVPLAWLSSFTFVPTLGIVLVIVPLIFPTGHVLSPRWHWAVGIAVVACIGRLIEGAFLPGPLDSVEAIWNPVGIDAIGAARPVLDLTNQLMLFVAFPLALWSVILRFRRGTPMERAQLKWFVSAAACAATFLGLSFVAPQPFDDVGWLLGILGVGLIPVSIAIALLRYRLYDIDRIISRTIAWAVVSAILVGGFAAGIVALQTVLTGVTQGQTLAVAATTLVAFGAAQPLLRWVQAGVDRRFNRARYDAQRTVDAFGERLRDTVAMETVASDLQSTIDLAVRPAAQGLWLRGRFTDPKAMPAAP